MPKSGSSPRDKQVTPDAFAKTDWSKCAICQQKKVEPLRCPADSKRSCDVDIRLQDLPGLGI